MLRSIWHEGEGWKEFPREERTLGNLKKSREIREPVDWRTDGAQRGPLESSSKPAVPGMCWASRCSMLDPMMDLQLSIIRHHSWPRPWLRHLSWLHQIQTLSEIALPCSLFILYNPLVPAPV